MFPLRTDLLAVTPHHVLHAHLTQMLRRLPTQRDFTMLQALLDRNVIEHLHEC